MDEDAHLQILPGQLLGRGTRQRDAFLLVYSSHGNASLEFGVRMGCGAKTGNAMFSPSVMLQVASDAKP